VTENAIVVIVVIVGM